MLSNLMLWSHWLWTCWALRLAHGFSRWPWVGRGLKRLRHGWTRATGPAIARRLVWLALALGQALAFGDVGPLCFDTALPALLAHPWRAACHRSRTRAWPPANPLPTVQHRSFR